MLNVRKESRLRPVGPPGPVILIMLAQLLSHFAEELVFRFAGSRFVEVKTASKEVAGYPTRVCFAAQPIEPSAYSSRLLAHRHSSVLAETLSHLVHSH